MSRHYEQTHPWITFNYTADPISPLSMKLGEAYSKCMHLAGTPLQPALAAHLASIYLAKGVNATTAIEGNTLSEEDVAQILDGQKTLPQSQAYLQREVENVSNVIVGIHQTSLSDAQLRLTPEWLKDVNRGVLDGIDTPDHVEPGEYTTASLVVGSVYRAAPPEDVPYLVGRLCDWVNDMLDHDPGTPEGRFMVRFHAAVLAHVYMAWIHPFGDGNGRTARALECAILGDSGLVPWVSSNLLSNHYNFTRSRYYERLSDASRKLDLAGFINYAAEGFVDQIREQILRVQKMQRNVAWVNFVHECFQYETQGETSKRRREVLLSLPEQEWTQRGAIRGLSANIARAYAGKGEKTIQRDINRLREMELLVVDSKRRVQPLVRRMDAFLPHNAAFLVS